MRAKTLLALGMMAAMASPQTMTNPANGQTVQQQMIADEVRPGDRFKQRKTSNRAKIRIKRDSFMLNQRQKRKRWRQQPSSRPMANRSRSGTRR